MYLQQLRKPLITSDNLLFVHFSYRKRRKKKRQASLPGEYKLAPIPIKDLQLIKLTKDLDEDLAVEVEECWIHPKRITPEHILGKGIGR